MPLSLDAYYILNYHLKNSFYCFIYILQGNTGYKQFIFLLDLSVLPASFED